MGNGDILEKKRLSEDMKITMTPYIFVNEKGEQLSLEWFNERINHYAKIIGIQKIKNIMQMGEL